VFEPHLTRVAQAHTWGLGAFAICCGLCALKLFKSSLQGGTGSPVEAALAQPPSVPVPSLAPGRPALLTLILWLTLPACASVLLLATTNQLCQDVAVIPFLWVFPLALYLLSFILCFDSPRWYRRFPFAIALVIALGAMYWAIPQKPGSAPFFSPSPFIAAACSSARWFVTGNSAG